MKIRFLTLVMFAAVWLAPVGCRRTTVHVDGDHEDHPPGWDKGKKEGWNGKDVPPGLDKKPGNMPPGQYKKLD